jgi:hypothetical protein
MHYCCCTFGIAETERCAYTFSDCIVRRETEMPKKEKKTETAQLLSSEVVLSGPALPRAARQAD